MRTAARPLCVLVVDDERDTAESTTTLLTLHGFHSVCAFGCDDALRAALNDPPDVALIDLTMPKADGCEVARRLRELGLPRPPLLIAITGSVSNWNRERAFAAGFQLYLIQPVPPEELVTLLGQCEMARAEKV